MTENLPAKREPSERDKRIAIALPQVEEGKSLAEIAEGLGITMQALSAWLLSRVPEQYREMQERGLIARITDADQKLETAESHLEVARADRVCKYARWDAERRLPTLFAVRTEITGAGGGPIQIDSLERARRVSFLRSLDAIDVDDVTQCSTSGGDLTSAAGSDHKP